MKMIFNNFRTNVGSATLIVFIFFLVAACTSKPKESTESDTDTKEEMSASTESNKIDPTPGGIKIAELLANKEKYAGQTVRVKGKSVKVNNMIMDRNWIHIQDGSVEGEDLTVTTTDNVTVGDMVVFEGVITLNKDFGSGYKYDIIMENAKVIK